MTRGRRLHVFSLRFAMFALLLASIGAAAVGDMAPSPPAVELAPDSAMPPDVPAVTELDLEGYWALPSTLDQMAVAAELLDAHGTGCVQREEQTPGGPFVESHAYFDPSTERWVVAVVSVEGPESQPVVGVLLTTVALCAERPELRRPFRPTDLYGIGLGDTVEELTTSLGPPLRRTPALLGTLKNVSVLEYYREPPDSGISVHYYVQDERIVALGVIIGS